MSVARDRRMFSSRWLFGICSSWSSLSRMDSIFTSIAVLTIYSSRNRHRSIRRSVWSKHQLRRIFPSNTNCTEIRMGHFVWTRPLANSFCGSLSITRVFPCINSPSKLVRRHCFLLVLLNWSFMSWTSTITHQRSIWSAMARRMWSSTICNVRRHRSPRSIWKIEMNQRRISAFIWTTVNTSTWNFSDKWKAVFSVNLSTSYRRRTTGSSLIINIPTVYWFMPVITINRISVRLVRLVGNCNRRSIDVISRSIRRRRSSISTKIFRSARPSFPRRRISPARRSLSPWMMREISSSIVKRGNCSHRDTSIERNRVSIACISCSITRGEFLWPFESSIRSADDPSSPESIFVSLHIDSKQIHLYNTSACRAETMVETYFQILSNCTIRALVVPPPIGRYRFTIDLKERVDYQDTFLLELREEKRSRTWVIVLCSSSSILLAMVFIVIVYRRHRATKQSMKNSAEHRQYHPASFRPSLSFSPRVLESTRSRLQVYGDDNQPSVSPIKDTRADDEGYSGSSNVSDRALALDSSIATLYDIPRLQLCTDISLV